MKDSDLRSRVREIVGAHLPDKDGGYGLLFDLQRFLRDLPSEDRDLAREVLVEVIARAEPNAWGAALEALVQEKTPATASTLRRLLESTHDKRGDVNEQVLFALLRLGYTPLLPEYRTYIKSRLNTYPDSHAAAELAYLVRIDPEGFPLAADALAGWLTRGYETYVGSLIPVFASVLEDWRTGGFVQLVREVETRDRWAGHRLAQLALNYLSQPWSADDVGSRRESLLAALLERAGSVDGRSGPGLSSA